MELIIGGAFQGKLNYAVKKYALSPCDICDCSKKEADFSAPCVCHFECFILNCIKSGTDPFSVIAQQLDLSGNTVIICDDIFCGIVSLEPTERALRESCGRVLEYIASEAKTVTRVFCGIGQEIKHE